MTLFQGITLGIVLVAAVWDLATRRIPNFVTFGAAIAGLAAHTYVAGAAGAGASAAGWLVGVACFFPFFALGGMGAGDVKLLAAIGAWLGPVPTVWVALYSAIAGGVMGLVVSLWAGYLTQALVNVSWIFRFWRSEGPRPVPELTLSTHKGPRLAYAVPVFAGLMVSLWL
jgi:prepilin peptidase CpaA